MRPKSPFFCLTGKSYLCEQILRDLGRPIVVLNDFTPQPFYPRVEWENVLALESTAVVAEDLVALDKKQLAILKKLLCFSNHHKRASVFFIIAWLLPRLLLLLLLFYNCVRTCMVAAMGKKI